MHLLIVISRAMLLITAFLVLHTTWCKADNSPGFFLKITKNVPRLGRRSDREFEGSFVNSYKNIPRIGRSLTSDAKSLTTWLSNQPSTSTTKRVLLTPHNSRMVAEQELSVVQPVNANTLMELLEKDAIASDNVKFVHWKDFDRALQLDAELYEKVISLGRRPDQRLKQDISGGNNNYLSIMGNTINEDGSDYMLYNRGGGGGGGGGGGAADWGYNGIQD